MPGQQSINQRYKRKMEESSESNLGKDKIAAALAQAQGMYGVAEKTEQGNFGAKKFAPLPNLWEACIPALAANEIAVVAYTYWSIVSAPYDDGVLPTPKKDPPEEPSKPIGAMQIFIVVSLVHSSGQTLSSEMPLIPERQTNKYDKRVRNEMQDIAASKSFMKRQLFQDLAFANIAEEDHDTLVRPAANGEEAQQEQPEQREEPPIDNSKASEYAETKEAFISDCTSMNKKFKEAGKESLFIQVVKEAGFSSLKGITKVEDMEKIITSLKEGEEKHLTTNDEKEEG